MKFIFRQFEVPLILRDFQEQHVPPFPVIDLGLTVEFYLSLEKSWKVSDFRPWYS